MEKKLGKAVVKEIKQDICSISPLKTNYACLAELKAVAQMFLETDITIDALGQVMSEQERNKLQAITVNPTDFAIKLGVDCHYSNGQALLDGRDVIFRLVKNQIAMDNLDKR